MSLRKILFIGMPGSGKSTQAKLLVDYGLTHISTGELIGRARRAGNPLLTPYGDQLDQGFLLPDKEIFMLIDQAIVKVEEQNIGYGYVLDGAVRNIAQAERVIDKDLLEDVLYFHLSDEEAIKRMKNRYQIEGRKEDAPENIPTRIAEYKRHTEPVLDYLRRNRFCVNAINASRPIDDVHDQIISFLWARK